MKKPKQHSFFNKRPTAFGGSFLLGKRKEARPISTKNPMHIVLKSKKAKGSFSFINHRSSIELALAKISSRFGIKIYDKSVNQDHIHTLVYFKSRSAYKAWIRTLTAEIVRIIARKTKTKLTNFFTERPFTKVIRWGRHFKVVLNYQILNQMEYFGLRPKKEVRLGKKYPDYT